MNSAPPAYEEPKGLTLLKAYGESEKKKCHECTWVMPEEYIPLRIVERYGRNLLYQLIYARSRGYGGGYKELDKDTAKEVGPCIHLYQKEYCKNVPKDDPELKLVKDIHMIAHKMYSNSIMDPYLLQAEAETTRNMCGTCKTND